LPPPIEPIYVPAPPVDTPADNEQAKIKYRDNNQGRTDDRRSGEGTKTRNQDGGRNQISRRR
jgi:hypothetical protein